MEYWPVRLLLIRKWLLLNSGNLTGRLTPDSLLFGMDYPDPTFLSAEQFRIAKCLMTLADVGDIKLTEIKINSTYLKFYTDTWRFKYTTSRGPYRFLDKKTKDLAKQQSFGLTNLTLNKIAQDQPLTLEELKAALSSDQTSSVNEWGEGIIFEKTSFTPKESVLMGNFTPEKNSLIGIKIDFSKFTAPERSKFFFLLFPIVAARFLSFKIRLNEAKVQNNFTKYLKQFKENKLSKVSKVAKFNFSYQLQKDVILKTIAGLSNNQQSPILEWRLGGWCKPEARQISFHHVVANPPDDEFILTFKKEFPGEYALWQSEWPVRRYQFRFFETLFTLEQEKMLLIKDIRTEVNRQSASLSDVYVGENFQSITALTLKWLNSKKFSEGLSFDLETHHVHYNGKSMWVKQEEHRRPLHVNLCLLMFGHPVCDPQEDDETNNQPLDLYKDYPNYQIGDSVSYDVLYEIIFTRRKLEGPSGDKYRPIRDAIDDLNERAEAEDELGTKIFEQGNQIVIVKVMI